MKPNYFEAPGGRVELGELQLPRVCDLASSLTAKRIEFAELVECRTTKDSEIVVFDLEVEVAQVQRYPIRSTERISASFDKSDDVVPILHALRTDFPQVPHLNLHRQEYPRNLCLYDEPYEDIKRGWTSPRFIHDIRKWLALTGQGKLHQDDQPLEPLLVDYLGHIVLPSPSQLMTREPVPLRIDRVRTVGAHQIFLIARRGQSQDGSADLLASVHVCNPQTHGVIRRRPATLADLATITSSAGFDLLTDLRCRLRAWFTHDSGVLDSQFLLVILFPKTRHEGGEIEVVDTWAFYLRGIERNKHDSGLQIRHLGCEIGLWDLSDGQVGLLLSPETSKQGEAVRVDVLKTVRDVDRSMAAKLNAEDHVDELRLVAVGLGSLGSHVVMNLARSGFGKWTLVDDDFLLPHNVVRHALDGNYVGWNKAEAVASSANTIVDGANLFSALAVNLISPTSDTEKLSTALTEADVILDMSTSLSVARRLASDTKGSARRISLFLTPSGRDLVLLAEDRNRNITLDALEMQYYRAVICDRRLSGHLDQMDHRYRYAQSCRDVTSRLPEHMVALHASQGSRALAVAVSRPTATMGIWRLKEDGFVQPIELTPAAVVRKQINNWTVVTDNGLLERLSALRQLKLPNETGGVLIGSFDMERRIVFIVHALPSPPDSEEWPTLYIRGSEGLTEKVAALTQRAHRMIEYIGEWHSHPEGVGTAPSTDDRRVFAWLEDLMQADGFPPVMIIVGASGTTRCFVDGIVDPFLTEDDGNEKLVSLH